ncbi:MAG: hypothetical protein NZ651_05345 [Candidatus Bipolaricaulota bacterium]|nr:hypothetical protein [Candidatus Bipolaricaulota bacterium]MDW8127178.1 hypothetical protein [Candidatus Bipolaricaulota bacterium]
MALILAWIVPLVAWLGHGYPLSPAWGSVLLAPILWTAGLVRGRRLLLPFGFLSFVALAASCTVGGRLLLGLALLGLSLLAWDCADFFRLPASARALAVRRQAFLWSGFVTGTGIALAIGASFLHLVVNFWALVGGMILVWMLFWLLLREITKAHGGETSGNRSVSEPIK